jgi:hypothetical protein
MLGHAFRRIMLYYIIDPSSPARGITYADLAGDIYRAFAEPAETSDSKALSDRPRHGR